MKKFNESIAEKRKEILNAREDCLNLAVTVYCHTNPSGDAVEAVLKIAEKFTAYILNGDK